MESTEKETNGGPCVVLVESDTIFSDQDAGACPILGQEDDQPEGDLRYPNQRLE